MLTLINKKTVISKITNIFREDGRGCATHCLRRVLLQTRVRVLALQNREIQFGYLIAIQAIKKSIFSHWFILNFNYVQQNIATLTFIYKFIIATAMSNLNEIQKHRLKLYGEMLKNDLLQKRSQQKIQRQALLRHDSIQLERHIENTKKLDHYKMKEIKEMNTALMEDNKMLSTFKKHASFTANYAEDGNNFIQQIHQFDSKRLDKLKNDLTQQYYDNKDYSTNKKNIEEKIKQIERVESDRHTNRIKEWQMDSVKNYQEIKRKHQQDMLLYEKHKRLVEENQSYRDQIESFTKGRGILDRYNRNQYLQRRANLRENQEQIVKQMQELGRRKSQEVIEYKKKVGDLEQSMLASILSKPPRYEPKAYSNELRTQMQDDSLRKLQETNSKKEKLELNNIYGGMQTNERHKMIEIIDRRLGIDKYAKSTNKINSRQEQSRSVLENNPETGQRKRYMTPKKSQSRDKQQKIDYSQRIEPKQNFTNDYSSELNSSQNRRYFKSYDVITGKNRIYAQ